MSISGGTIENQFDHADWNKASYSDEKITYLSRSDWEATFPAPVQLNATPELIAALAYDKAYDEDPAAVTPTYGAEKKYSLFEMADVAYDDPKWAEFMNQITLEETSELLASAYHNWGTQYFQHLHYIIMTAVLVISIGISVYRTINDKTQKNNPTPLSLWWLPIIQLFGCLLFTIAMMQQIEYHDYYFIDTFFSPLLWLLILALRDIPAFRRPLSVATEWALVFVLFFFMAQHVRHTQVTRRASENYAMICHDNYKDSEQLLDSLGVHKEAKILCLYGYAQNGPFLQMGRKGYIVMEDKDELIEAALRFDYDYVVVEDEKYAQYGEKRQELFSKWKKIGGNDKISVFLHP